ncbi:universal stress protein (plasmid) [Caballeronia sp. NK8]|uniref:universal stress protein n=1 Tax=Caballeronia sp. NK8 TaxID=140098 RepID=UPI001BB7E5B6|nr:universal stress protein [Caballeronia sp. NK8]BCQ28999.1 universal stress protein [Caballeronia sp. NK8]
MYHRILVPLDGSAIASRALDEALELPHETGAQIQVLYVVDAPPVSARASPHCFQDFHDAYAREGNAVCAEAAIRMEEADFQSSTRVAEVNLADDDLAQRIATSAGEFGADLVVMGTHGRRGWRRIMLGSVAERVVRLAPCPVLLVPARTHICDQQNTRGASLRKAARNRNLPTETTS